MSFCRIFRSGRKKCRDARRFPHCPSSGERRTGNVAGGAPQGRCAGPSITMAERPRRGTSMRPIRPSSATGRGTCAGVAATGSRRSISALELAALHSLEIQESTITNPQYPKPTTAAANRSSCIDRRAASPSGMESRASFGGFTLIEVSGAGAHQEFALSGPSAP